MSKTMTIMHTCACALQQSIFSPKGTFMKVALFSGNLQSCPVLWPLCGFGRWQTHLRNKDYFGSCWTTGTANASSHFGWNQDWKMIFLGSSWMLEWLNPIVFFKGREWPGGNPRNCSSTRCAKIKTLKVLRSPVHNWNRKSMHGIRGRKTFRTWQQHLIFGFNSFSKSQLHGSCFYLLRLE